MTYSFKEQSFETKRDDLQTAISWLSEIGVTYFNSRIAKYQRDLEVLLRARSANEIDKLLDDGKFPALVNSLYEATELIAIHKGLSRIITTEELVSRLRVFTHGPEFAADEKIRASSNTPRDLAFELFTASLFALAEFKVDFTTQADLVAYDGTKTFFVECKRPRQDTSVHSCAKGAASQLRRRYRSHASHVSVYGIIALSIDKIVNPDHFLLVTDDENALDKRMTSETQTFVTKYHRHWSTLDDPQTIGVIALLQIAAVPENRKIITTCNFLGANHISHSESDAGKVFTDVVNKLGASVMDISDGGTSRQALDGRGA
jgi:hypothetical protein